MRQYLFGLCAAFSVLTIGVVGAHAEQQKWIIDQGGSSVGVQYITNDEPREGRFDRFSGEAWFDPDDMASARLVFTVEAESIVFGDQLATDFVKSQDWFWVTEHPQAIYTLEALEHIEGDQYRAQGVLKLRGVEKSVEGQIKVEIAGDLARASGQVDFDRRDFEVGVGFTSFLVSISNDVSVLFELTAHPAE